MTKNAQRSFVSRCRAACLILALTATCAYQAIADEFTDRVNRAFIDIKPDRRSDLILLPLLAKLDPTPADVNSIEKAALVLKGHSAWSAAEAWAKAPAQQALIKALSSVTKEEDWRKAYGFGLPYGIDNVPIELIQANLFADLGDPPTLAAVKLGYLDALKNLSCLIHVEASRLTGEGKVSDAIDLLTDFMVFGRQMCDRQFFDEIRYGFHTIIQSNERIRDVVYIDSTTTKALDTGRLRNQLKRFDVSSSYLSLTRMKFPIGNRTAAEQLISRVYGTNTNVDADLFASTMSRITTTSRPLRLFSESGKWRSVASTLGTRSEAETNIGALYNDWNTRWTIPMFDNRLATVSPFSIFDANKFATFKSVIPNLTTLYDLRHLCRVEVIGTRRALAVMGYKATIGNYPPRLISIQPAWLPLDEADPYNPNIANNAKPGLEFFVPIRDAQAFDGAGMPHEVRIVLERSDHLIVSRGSPFQVSLKDDVFVLYSVGTDSAKNNAKIIQNTGELVQGADYLIWPPVVSLVRQNMIDRGELK